MLMINYKSRNQSGFVSIVVALLIMVIISLITIGFTRLMQREQRQSLDRQLSRQALYAAESGINDVYSALQTNPALPAEKTACDVSLPPSVNSGIIDEVGAVRYTCALYDKTPTELVYSLSTTESKIVELKTDSGRPFRVLNIKWGNEQGTNDVTALPACGVNAGTFPTSRSGNVPIIRLDLTNTTLLSRDGLINGTDNLYIVPCKNGTPVTTYNYLPSAPKGQVVEVACVAGLALPCELNISGLSSVSYGARLRSVYDSAQVTIKATETTIAGVAGVAEFRQAQTSIDVTARASDVVRRLRVSIPFAKAIGPPEGVFQAFDGVCKLLTVDINLPARVSDNCTY